MKLLPAFRLLPILAAQERPIVIKAGMILDGKGGTLRNMSIVVQGSKIQKV